MAAPERQNSKDGPMLNGDIIYEQKLQGYVDHQGSL
jgi:hypothetical protein